MPDFLTRLLCVPLSRTPADCKARLLRRRACPVCSGACSVVKNACSLCPVNIIKKKNSFSLKISRTHGTPIFYDGPRDGTHGTRAMHGRARATAPMGHTPCVKPRGSCAAVRRQPRAGRLGRQKLVRPLARKTARTMALSIAATVLRGRPDPAARSPRHARSASSFALTSETPCTETHDPSAFTTSAAIDVGPSPWCRCALIWPTSKGVSRAIVACRGATALLGPRAALALSTCAAPRVLVQVRRCARTANHPP